MKIQIISVGLSLLCFSSPVRAQFKKLVTSGTIEYVKTYNKFAIIQKDIDERNSVSLREELTRYKANSKQFLKLRSKLTFTRGKTLFVPLSDQSVFEENRWNGSVFASQINTIYTDLQTKTVQIEKTVLGASQTIRDKVRPIRWKITDEMREIAGFACRRANGLIMDSVYVVAFFTGEIPVSGGPESFSGLPGMILGVAVPDEHITWFATDVSPTLLQEPVPPTSTTKPVTFGEMIQMLKPMLKSYVNEGRSLLRKWML